MEPQSHSSFIIFLFISDLTIYDTLKYIADNNINNQAINIESLNKYLFGEKFEEKTSNITTAKKKSKTVFTGRQKISTSTLPPSHQTFRVDPPS